MNGAACNIPNWVHPPEDSYVLSLADGVAAVFDGLAGHGHGDEASRLAADTLTTLLPPDKADRWVLDALGTVRSHLRAARQADDERRYMTSTAVLAQLRPDGSFQVAWCGDSRCYLVRSDGGIVSLTDDHDLLYEQASRSFISPGKARGVRLAISDAHTDSDAWRLGGGIGKKAFRKRSTMISELSSGPIDLLTDKLTGGAFLLLCSDGVHDNLTFSRMRELAQQHAGNPMSAAEAFAREAERAGRAGEGRAHPDDITCVTLAL